MLPFSLAIREYCSESRLDFSYRVLSCELVATVLRRRHVARSRGVRSALSRRAAARAARSAHRLGARVLPVQTLAGRRAARARAPPARPLRARRAREAAGVALRLERDVSARAPTAAHDAAVGRSRPDAHIELLHSFCCACVRVFRFTTLRNVLSIRLSLIFSTFIQRVISIRIRLERSSGFDQCTLSQCILSFYVSVIKM